MNFDLSTPLIMRWRGAKQAALACGVRSALVLAIDDRRHNTQICDDVVAWLPVYVVNLPMWHGAMLNQPNEVVCGVVPHPHSDPQVPFWRCVPRRPCPGSFSPRESACFRVVLIGAQYIIRRHKSSFLKPKPCSLGLGFQPHVPAQSCTASTPGLVRGADLGGCSATGFLRCSRHWLDRLLDG